MRPVIVAHVAVTTSPDYLTRREPHRQAHIERLRQLRAAGTFVAGGAFPDGRGADLFYRVGHLAEVDALIVEDPYHRSGAWAGHASRPFSEFVDPWHVVPPVVLDGSRRVTVVEGPAGDPELARFALIELRGQGRLLLGGTLRGGASGGGGDTLAVLSTPDPTDALGWLGETGLWDPADLRAHSLLHVL